MTVNDGGASNNLVTQSFTVTVSQVNLPPTLNPLGNLGLIQNSGSQTVALSGITSGLTNTLTLMMVTATPQQPGLIPNPTVSYVNMSTNGTLTFAPVAGATGTSAITVTVNNGSAPQQPLQPHVHGHGSAIGQHAAQHHQFADEQSGRCRTSGQLQRDGGGNRAVELSMAVQLHEFAGLGV